MDKATIQLWNPAEAIEVGRTYRPNPSATTLDGKPMSAKAQFYAFAEKCLDPYTRRECLAPTEEGEGVGPDGGYVSRVHTFETTDGEKSVVILESHPSVRFEAFQLKKVWNRK